MKRLALSVLACAVLSACAAVPKAPNAEAVEAPPALAEGAVFITPAVGVSRYESAVQAVALAQTPGYRESTQLLTASAPTASTAGWFSLGGWTKFRVYVCADTAARTLSGAGTLRAYYKHDATGVVMRNPSLDLPISVTSTSCNGAACRCQVFPDFVTGGVGGVYFAADAVTTSAGTQALVGVIGGKQ